MRSIRFAPSRPPPIRDSSSSAAWRSSAPIRRNSTARSQDFLTVIAEHAAEVRAGALEGGGAAAQIAIESLTPPVAARVAAFQGSVFVKGSRRYALEKTLPPSAVESGEAAALARAPAPVHA